MNHLGKSPEDLALKTCKYKYGSGDWRQRMETFSSVVVSNPPWFGSNRKYSFLMTVWGPTWKQSVVSSVTASKQTHIWYMYQQRPIYFPAKLRHISRTVLDLWLKSDLRPNKSLSQPSLLLQHFPPVLNPVKTETAMYKLLLACLLSETKPNYHNPFLDIFFWLTQLSTALISRA